MARPINSGRARILRASEGWVDPLDAETWFAFRDQILADRRVRRRPGARPPSFWLYEAPRELVGKEADPDFAFVPFCEAHPELEPMDAFGAFFAEEEELDRRRLAWLRETGQLEEWELEALEQGEYQPQAIEGRPTDG